MTTDVELRSTTASGVGKPGGGAAVYETKKAVSEYLQFHYATPGDLFPGFDESICPPNSLNFPFRLAKLCADNTKEKHRALDIGCAVGGASFQLSRDFTEVVGIDFSQAFVDAANDMRSKKELPYTSVIQGDLKKECTAKIELECNPDSCKFEQGDACNLNAEKLGKFDAILAANLLCRLPEPMKFINSLPSLLSDNGIVVLVSPYSWLVEYTPKDKWIGAKDGENSADAIKKIMNSLNFELVKESNVPFLIREHERKYQWGCSHCTIWMLR